MSRLPESWVAISLSEAATNISIIDNKIPQKNYLPEGAYPIFDQGQEYIGGYTDQKEKIVECDLPVIIFGDHTRVVKFVNRPFASGADGVKVLRPKQFFHPKLFEYFTRHIATHLTNKGYARHYQHLAKSVIHLPPIAEQHRIVAKIEELFSELDKGIESLKIAREQIKIYCQSLLKHAFEGMLTAQWREENKNKHETAEVVLKRIQAEREESYQKQIADRKTNNIRGRKPTAPPALPLISSDELDKLPELPNEWTWVNFESLFQPLSDGGLKIKQRDYLDAGLIPIIDQGEKFVGGYSNDLTMKWNGPLPVLVFGDHTKRFKLIDFPFALGADGAKLIGLPKACNPAYCYYISHTRRFEDRGYSRHFQFLRKSCFPLCSKAEQDEIIRIIDVQFSNIGQLEQTIDETLQQADAMRQSILKKAFSGQLVPQDPDDEPASVLLERNQAEKAAQPQRKKARA